MWVVGAQAARQQGHVHPRASPVHPLLLLTGNTPAAALRGAGRVLLRCLSVGFF